MIFNLLLFDTPENQKGPDSEDDDVQDNRANQLGNDRVEDAQEQSKDSPADGNIAKNVNSIEDAPKGNDNSGVGGDGGNLTDDDEDAVEFAVVISGNNQNRCQRLIAESKVAFTSVCHCQGLVLIDSKYFEE